MRTGPKYKICKRLGAGVFDKCQTQKFALSESREGKKRKSGAPRGLSDYGKQLREKQKVRYTYGLSEHQLGKYVAQAIRLRGTDSGTELIRQLELRLDNVMYRAGLGSTRAMARQLVSHGHVLINGTRVTIPSYRVSVGDVISIRAGSKNRTPFTTASDRLAEHTAPAWLHFDVNALEGKIKSEPAITPSELQFDLGVVLEYYSR